MRHRAVTAARRHPQVVDGAFAASLAAIYLGVILSGFTHPGRGERPHLSVALAATVVAALAIAGRRRRPMPALLVVTAGTIVFLVLGHEQPILMVALVIATYTMASRAHRRSAWLVGTAVALALYLVRVMTLGDGWWAPEALGTVAWVGMAIAFGDATRNRRAYVAEIEARAHRAEQTREEEARRRVAEERIRIARELHDVVAHHIAVINVQAGAAAHVLNDQPEKAGPALAHIRRAADTVIKELASVVGVLRQPDDVSTEPTRGLAGIEDLLEMLASVGLTVQRQQHGTARELPAVADLAAYRIVQEALTNAHKHGTGGATLSITYAPDEIIIEITNPAPAEHRSADIGGYGIIGMRERAAAAGGAISVGRRADNQFVVRAVLPLPADDQEPAERRP
ncbi:two-component sensor histidine kinase [Micromonospora endophytica]|uniref:sensor histidine kinase n=1 Tax=Micromonospora endophytica TaxID=515350 RepID=UPI000DAA8B8E|nr:histidine kinase [Micromonospora endophytica]RIW42075.1 two-component sensor histidine kinase [Micromonospora endophytica]